MSSAYKKLILASGSPRRKELLSHLVSQFTIKVSRIEETEVSELDNIKMPHEKSQILAALKAKDIFQSLAQEVKKSATVIGADTIVVFDRKILEKPRDVNEAREVLISLSGKSHEVYTSVAIIDEQMQREFTCKSVVKFSHIDSLTLERYLLTNESLDKAGSYGIQGAALSFIERVEGSYSNVVGLPINELRIEFQNKWGIDWRSLYS